MIEPSSSPEPNAAPRPVAGSAARFETTGSPAPVATSEEKRAAKQRLELENRRRLDEDLAERRLVFTSLPHDAFVQFSNLCNMSCIMCWDGLNPELRRMSPELVKRLAEEIAPTLSLLTPHFGNEPLLLTWDDTRRLAQEHDVQLSLTTNVQFLTERRFRELEDITQTLLLSVDSHIPEVLGRIRPGAKVDRVLANLPLAARLAEERGIECIANVVFLMENAAQLDDTVAFLADSGVPTVHVLQLIAFNGRSDLSDPLIQCSQAYVEWIKRRCIAVAREKKLRLLWSVAGHELHDFRERAIGPAPRKAWDDAWKIRFAQQHPRYCPNAVKGVKIETDGEVTPCCYATEGRLVLGNLGRQPFAEIWNGAEARDLRRGMLTGDVPALCTTCHARDPVPPAPHLPFIDHVDVLFRRSLKNLRATLETLGPDHMTRRTTPPRVRLRDPGSGIESWFLALSPGGEAERIETAPLVPVAEVGAGAAATLEFEIPPAVWERLETNVGIWWAVFGFSNTGETDDAEVLRSAEVRCLVRHEDLARVPGSTLRYEDQGHRPNRDLGGGKQPGWRAEVDSPALLAEAPPSASRPKANPIDA